MKHLVLFTLVTLFYFTASSQITFRTAQSGNYTSTTTWQGGAAGTPLTNGVCNCKIVVAAGHTLKLDANVSLTNANIVLDGINSILTFDNNMDLTLLGTNSSIDIQTSQASIIRGNANNQIFLGGAEIYNGNFEFQSATNGTVQGPASASSARANPQFQSGILPVTLSEFKIVSKTDGVTLSWKTATEVNSSHFEIERSIDGKTWSTKGSVNAAGNVSVDQNYSFIDAVPENGTNYYRLKIVDTDNRFEYSPVKSVSFSATSLNVFAGPSPAHSYLNVNVNTPGNEPYRLRLINRSGQVVLDQKFAASNNRLQLSVSNYSDGTYFLEVTNSSGARQINKIMIVRK
jgi:hypothetical protein